MGAMFAVLGEHHDSCWNAVSSRAAVDCVRVSTPLFFCSMRSELGVVTVAEAAERLDLSQQRVRALVQRGELDGIRTSGGWLIDVDAVSRRVLSAQLGLADSPARPWSERNAWAVMRALDGDESLLPALSTWDRSRVRERLVDPDPAVLLSAVRNRARTVRVSVHPSRVDRLYELVVPSGVQAAGRHGFGLTGGGGVDGYLSADVLANARHTLGVRDSDTGDHHLRVVGDARLIEGLALAPRLAVAADLVDHAVGDGAVDGRVASTIKTILAALTRGSDPPRR